jgi:hypothetical protein
MLRPDSHPDLSERIQELKDPRKRLHLFSELPQHLIFMGAVIGNLRR